MDSVSSYAPNAGQPLCGLLLLVVLGMAENDLTQTLKVHPNLDGPTVHLLSLLGQSSFSYI